MDSSRLLRVSILIPVFNEEANVSRAYETVASVFDNLPGYELELIFTDNHSTDGTFRLLRQIALEDARVRVIRFSRNYGYQRSLLTGYKAASGDCSIQIDCDLQDPPEHIPHMLSLWRQGHQVVYGIRRTTEEGWIIRTVRRIFYRAIRAMSDDDLPLNAGEFRLVDKRILTELRKIDDTAPYLRGLISSMGFSQIGFEYDRRARLAGHSKFPFRAMLALAVDGVLNHSLVPLRLASLASIVIGAVTFIILFGYLIGKLVFGQDWPAGFATTTVLLLMSMTLNALFFGIMGEYLGRVFVASRGRLDPIIEVSINCEKHLTKEAADRG